MGLKRFAVVLIGSVLLSIVLLNISDATRERGLDGVIYFTAFSMCIAVTKPATVKNKLHMEGGSVENTYALIFFVVSPFIGSFAWYSTTIVHSLIQQMGFPWNG